MVVIPGLESSFENEVPSGITMVICPAMGLKETILGIDSCCGEYLLKDRALFHHIEPVEPLKLQTANGETIASAGGPATVEVLRSDGKIQKIDIKFAYLIELPINLLPLVRYLNDSGYEAQMNGNGGAVIDPKSGEVIFEYEKRENVAVARMKSASYSYCASNISSSEIDSGFISTSGQSRSDIL